MGALVWVGAGLWALAILLYLTVHEPAAVLTTRTIGIVGVVLLVAGLIKRRRERPSHD